MANILLHICCAVCASSVVETLRNQGFSVTGFFYNPNIHPEKEYIKRLKEMKKLAQKIKLPLTIGKYDVKRWFFLVKGLEDEPESGKRCEVCFRWRLEKTSQLCEKKKIEFFTTTLTVSPHKSSKVINKVGTNISDKFIEFDFKKKDGFKRAIELSKIYNLYRQNYCGCIFSIPNSTA